MATKPLIIDDILGVRPTIDRAKLNATDDHEIDRQIAADPDTAPDMSAQVQPPVRRTGRVRTPVRSAGYRFEIYKDKSGEYRFRFKASNGETMFGSEGYRAKASAMRAIQSIKLHTSAADVLDDS